jgi:hypothetical protein
MEVGGPQDLHLVFPAQPQVEEALEYKKKHGHFCCIKLKLKKSNLNQAFHFTKEHYKKILNLL